MLFRVSPWCEYEDFEDHVKKSRVSLMLVEATGAISLRSLTVSSGTTPDAPEARAAGTRRSMASRARARRTTTSTTSRGSLGEAAGIHRAIMIKKQARCADMH